MIGVFENLLRHVRLLGRESVRKVRLRLALTLKELCLNLMNQYCATPAVLNGGEGARAAIPIQHLRQIMPFSILLVCLNGTSSAGVPFDHDIFGQPRRPSISSGDS
jgi:hypothetical protein